jgi:hypothetical protein
MIGNIPAESAWERARIGRFTASRIDELLKQPRDKSARAAGQWSDTALSYIKSRAAEIITGTMRQFSTWATDWGNMYEPVAAERLLARYPGMTYLGKESPEFFKFSDFSGGSPDTTMQQVNLVGEIKCPENPVNHVDYCMMQSAQELKKRDKGYYHQIQMNMASCAKAWEVDFKDMHGIFVSYCPIVKDGYTDLKILPIPADMAFYERLVGVIEKAEQCLADLVWSLKIQSVQPAGSVIELPQYNHHGQAQAV